MQCGVVQLVPLYHIYIAKRFTFWKEMSSEDERMTSPMRKRVIARKDDTKESTPTTSDATYTTASRSSERLRKKANQTFQLPTRDDVWKDIPHSTTPNKTMSRCKRRLLVNNLFKE